MSVVLATDRCETIGPVIAALRRQTIRDQIELVIVLISPGPAALESAGLEDFAGYRIVEPGRPLTLSESRDAGVRASTAPVVVIGETHAFPHDDWAERLLETQAAGWTVVVPGIRNANPEGPISWANLLLDYGRWLDILPAGPIHSCPPYNAAFERAVALRLAELGDNAFSPARDLAVLLPNGRQAIYLEPAAKIDHVNVSRARFWLTQRFFAGRAHAAVRSRAWSWRRRLVYALGAPLIPAVVLTRLGRPVHAALRTRDLPLLTLPALLLGTAAGALGELTAFLAGAGRAGERIADGYELQKMSYTRMRPGA
jgi:glycosyl transferase family 2